MLAIEHAISNAIVVVDLEPNADPPKVLAIGLTTPGTSWRSSGSSSMLGER